MRIKQPTGIPAIDLALDTLDKKKQAFIFVNSKRSAERTAEDVAKSAGMEGDELKALADQVKGVLPKPTKQCARLAFCLERGVAFHHAGLVGKQRELIEDGFRRGVIKIIACTPTLAAGVDLPAFRTILRDVKRYGSPWGLSWIPVLEYMQQAGRAGRPSFDDFGEALVVAANDADRKEIIKRYLSGEPEEIFSKLAVEPVLRTYVLSLIVAGYITDEKGMFGFFERTFWAHQYKDMEKLKSKLQKVVQQLKEWEFLTPSDDFVSADDLGKEDAGLKATLIGRRVAELYLDPLTAYSLMQGLRLASSAEVKAVTFLNLVASALEMRPYPRIKAAEWEDMQEKLAAYSPYLVVKEPSLYAAEYEDFLSSFKLTLMLMDWVEEKDEEYLLEGYSIRPGELRVKLDLADWLLYACEELSNIMQFRAVRSHVSKTRFRARYGVKEELFALLKLKNVGRVRARRLYNSRIRDLSDVKRADAHVLSQIVGPAVAKDIKKQVGQEVEVVPERKRKGQVSLKDF